MSTEPTVELIADLVQRHQAEIPEWGHLPAAMRFKQAVVARVGIDRAFRLCQQVLAVPGLERMTVRRFTSLRRAAEERALSFRELWPGGARFTLPPPRVIGEGNQAPLHGVDRSAYLACFENVAVRGRSALILSESDALFDFEGQEFSNFNDNPEYDPGVLHSTRETLWTMEPRHPDMTVDEAFLLSGAHTVDFGHWMVEYLPKYIIAALSGLPPHVPVLIDERMPSTHREALELVLSRESRIIVVPHLAPVQVGRLWCAPNPMYMGFYPTDWNQEIWAHEATEPARFATLVRELVRRAGSVLDEPTGCPRVFIARKPQRKKKLTNHREIEAVARTRAFKIVYPEDMSFVDQMRMAHHARHIVGPDGSGMFLGLFARPGARMCVLNPRYTLPLGDVNAMLASLGVDLTVMSGVETSNDDFCPFWYDYVIPMPQFSECLDRWLTERAPTPQANGHV